MPPFPPRETIHPITHPSTTPPPGISCHAWNKDGTQLALSPNNNELHIYRVDDGAGTWTRTHVFTEHDMLISSVDWSHATNKIVTCSHDRNAFVWTYHPPDDDKAESGGSPAATVATPTSRGSAAAASTVPSSSQVRTSTSVNPDVDKGSWWPSLTLLRIDRAALDVKWSPDGKKFAVASGAKAVPVCHYEAEHDWWVCRMLKKHKSSVLSVAWHPNGQLLATGGCDFRCRVFSAHVEAVDGPLDAGPFAEAHVFGELVVEFPCAGWVHCVAWSPSGHTLAFTGHDCRVHVVTFPTPPGAQPPGEAVVALSGLPVTVLHFVSERVLIGGGHDCTPLLLTGHGGKWAFLHYLDPTGCGPKSPTPASPERPPSNSSVQAARAVFQSKVAAAQVSSSPGTSPVSIQRKQRVANEGELAKHQAAIVSLQPCPRKWSGTKKHRTVFSTTAMDGKLIIWTLPELNVALASMAV